MSEGGAFGSSQKQIYFLLAGFFLLGILFFFGFMISSYQSKLTFVPDKLKGELISMRFANIPECFAFQDNLTERVYPGVIDLSKFNNKTMQGCYKTEQKNGFKDFNFGLELLENKNFIFTNNYYNKDDFAIYKKVLVKNGSKMSEDTLAIYVQVRIGDPQQ